MIQYNRLTITNIFTIDFLTRYYLKFLSLNIKFILAFSLVLNSFCKIEAEEPIYYKLFSEQRLRRHINFLGNDLFEGRAVGTTGANLAAKYLADKFDEIGLRPIGTNSTFYQYIPMHASFPLSECEIKVHSDSLEYDLDFGKDFYLYNTGEQAFVAGLQDLVFVGYGINAMEFDYSDYFYTEVEGKIAVFLSGEPKSTSESFFNGDKPSKYSSPSMKQRTALAMGAKGSILIADVSDFNNTSYNKYLNTFAFENVNLAYSPAGSLNILMPPESAQILFENSEHSLKDIFQLERNNKLRSFGLKSKIDFIGKFKERDFISQNIVGMLPANSADATDEYIIVSAHYDHLGIGPAIAGDSIYNGVLDNALGCAGLLELAEYLISSKAQLNRSVIFILTTGEEKGLLGSSYYIDNPLVPLYKTIANINIDGLAFIDEFSSIVPVGSELSELSEHIHSVAQKLNLAVKGIPDEFMESQDAFLMSDQAAFAGGGIPSVLIMDGIDYKHIDRTIGLNRLMDYSKNNYHTPTDDFTIDINYNATKEHLYYLANLIIQLSNCKTPPEWFSGSPYSNVRLRTRAEKR